MARIICVANGKGGVNKTTTTVNLGYELAKKGFRVLFVDFDSQSDLSKYFTNMDSEFYIGDVLLDHKFDIQKAIYPAIIKGDEMPNLYIIPGRTRDVMTKLDMDMVSLQRREQRLEMQLKKVADEFDFVICDTPPTANTLVMNAVNAADEFIIPTEFKSNSLDGIDTVLDHIQEVKFCEEDEINFLVVPSKIDKRAKKSLTYGIEYCEERFPDNTAKTTIWQRSDFTDAEFRSLPCSVANPASEAAMYYKNLANEVINNVA